jgi:hypothetical protein
MDFIGSLPFMNERGAIPVSFDILHPRVLQREDSIFVGP